MEINFKRFQPAVPSGIDRFLSSTFLAPHITLNTLIELIEKTIKK